MKKYGVNYYEALNIIAKDFNLIKGSNNVKEAPIIVKPLKETEKTRIQVQIKDFTEQELKRWESFGISKKL
jgi:uncharacterized protein YlxP (DUF503 family)